MDTDYETHRRVAVARELTFAAGCPLRDRYGFAAAGKDVPGRRPGAAPCVRPRRRRRAHLAVQVQAASPLGGSAHAE
jgi:hypothetical protein